MCRVDLEKTQMAAEGLAKLKNPARVMATRQFNIDNVWIDGNKQQCSMCVASNNPFCHCIVQ